MVGSSSSPLDQAPIRTPCTVQSTAKGIFILCRSMKYNAFPARTVTEILGVYDNVDILTDAVKNIYAIKWADVDLRIKSLINGYREIGLTRVIGGSKENPDIIRYVITHLDLNVTDPEMACEI